MFKKPLFRVSKQLLLDLATYKNEVIYTNIEPEYKDYSKCENCPMKKFNKTWIGSSFCENKCVFVLSTSSIKSNRSQQKTVSKGLSHLQMLQLLLYHSYVYDGNGETIELTSKEVAKALDCTERTARDNISVLVDAGYIFINYKDNSSYKVFVRDYYKYHEKNTRGYMSITLECFENILKIDNINTLRFVLNTLVKLDDMRVSKKADIKKEFTLKSLMKLFPSNINSKKQLLAIINKARSIFRIKKTVDAIIVAFKSNIDSIKAKEDLEVTNKRIIKKLTKRFDTLKSLSHKDKADLIQMSIQYNINILIKSLFGIISRGLVPNELGSYLRTMIRKDLNIKASPILNSY